MNTDIMQPGSHRSGQTLRAASLLALALLLLAGCGGTPAKKQNNFFTSGSREADQRASQRLAKSEQISGSKKGSGSSGSESGKGGAEQIEQRRTLYDRLGGEAGLQAIVEDFLPRVMQDPRVNWTRQGVKHGGFFSHDTSPVWTPTAPNVANLKKHMVQFLALTSGGPAQYQGKEIRTTHQNMQVTNAEFDAAVGDLKASLDRLKIADPEQKELLAIIESTRPQIVTER